MTLSGAQTKKLTISLNGAGKRQLAAHHKLKVKLTITQAGKTIYSHNVTLKLVTNKRR